MNQPIIVITGLPGSGKTYISKKLAEELGYDLSNHDDYVRKLYELEPGEKLLKLLGTKDRTEIKNMLTEETTQTLKILNRVFRKQVIKEMLRLRRNSENGLIVDIPMFFESNCDVVLTRLKETYFVINIEATSFTRSSRLTEKRNLRVNDITLYTKLHYEERLKRIFSDFTMVNELNDDLTNIKLTLNICKAIKILSNIGVRWQLVNLVEVMQRMEDNKKQRFYHNSSHIIDMLQYVEDKIKLNIYPIELITAILYHDIVYDPKRKDNEEKSVLELKHDFVNSKFVRNVAKLIMCTKSHNTDDIHSFLIPTANLLIEADLSILGSENIVKYNEYLSKVYAEYSFLNHNVFIEGRIKFINEMLSKPFIVLDSELNERIKNNLLKEKEFLCSGNGSISNWS